MTLEPQSQRKNSNDAYYGYLFTQSPYWSTPYPNPDEAARWGKIVGYVSKVVHQYSGSEALKILDLGCGRGWLTHLLSDFGDVQGIDPVAKVIENGFELYPNLNLDTGTAETILSRSDFTPFDLVITSEVIEHIPDDEKLSFLQSIYRLLASGGYLILTTPRGKLWKKVEKHSHAKGLQLQPVEDWIREDELANLFSRSGFRVIENTRACPNPRGGRLFWRLWRSSKAANLLKALNLQSMRVAMAFSICKYQIWWVQKNDSN